MINPIYAEETARKWIVDQFRARNFRPPTPSRVTQIAEILSRLDVDDWPAAFEAATKQERIADQVLWYEASRNFDKTSRVLSNVSGLLGIVAWFASLANFLPPPATILDWILRASPYLVTPLGVVTALFLFACRGYLPRFYGTLEIIVGIWTVSSTASSVTLNQIPSLLPFLGGIYVIIRGLDNYSKGLTSKTRLGYVFGVLFNSPKREVTKVITPIESIKDTKTSA